MPAKPAPRIVIRQNPGAAAGTDRPDQRHQRLPDQRLPGGAGLSGGGYCRRSKSCGDGLRFLRRAEGIQPAGARSRQSMNNNLDLIMDFTGPFGFFSKLLLLSMNGLHALGIELRPDHHRHHHHHQTGLLAVDQREHQIAKADAGPPAATQSHRRTNTRTIRPRRTKRRWSSRRSTRSARWAVACRRCCNSPFSLVFTTCCATPSNCAALISFGPLTFRQPDTVGRTRRLSHQPAAADHGRDPACGSRT